MNSSRLSLAFANDTPADRDSLRLFARHVSVACRCLSKGGLSLLHLFIGLGLLLVAASGAQATAFTDSVSTDPIGGGAHSSTFTHTLSGVPFVYTFTASGEGGDIVFDAANGSANSSSILITSLSFNNSTTERLTITRQDGGRFTFSSLYVNNSGGQTISVAGYRASALVGSAQAVSTGTAANLTFPNLDVDEVRVSATDFFNSNLDEFKGDTDPPALTAPAPPAIGTATPGDAQASVTFAAPSSNGGAAITTYTATASPGGAVGSCAGPAACTITVSSLTNGTPYSFTVTATNSIGTGSASAASNSVTPKGAQSITFANPGAKAFGTSPTIVATASSGLSPSFTSTTTGVCTITVGGTLTFVTAGICTINADQVGNGFFSPAAQVQQSFTVNAIVPGAPAIGTATAGDMQATVTFALPASNGGAPITTYTVTASPGGATSSGTASPILLTGLTNGTTYAFSVTATNLAGTGSASSSSNSVVPKAIQTITFGNPGAQNFGTTRTLTATSTSALPLTFTSTTTGVCTITAGGTLSFISTGTCTVNADQSGSGSYLAANQVQQSFAVNAVVPSAPIIGVATAGDTQASVTFTAPSFTGGAPISGYTVTSNPGGVTSTGVSSPIVVTGLTNGLAYTFTVKATNSVGTGTASAASNPVTAKAMQTITFANPGTRNFGTTPTLFATSDSGLAPTFTSSTAGVCNITTSGSLTFLAAGSCTVNADQIGNGSFLPAAQVSRTFAVNAVVPAAPTIGTASGGDTQASVLFTVPFSDGGATITSYTVTSNPSGVTATGTASPIVISGLVNGRPYTFTVTATNSAGTGLASAQSNSVTPVAAAATSPFSSLALAAPVSGIVGIPSVVDMAQGNGPAMGNCVADVVRQVLGGSVAYLGQSASGATHIAWNENVISFYPLSATTANAGPTGIHTQGTNPLSVVSNCGTLTVAPAVYSLSELGATLASMGLTAEIDTQGVITVVVNGTVYVVRPDFVVSPGMHGAPRLFFGADGMYRFSDTVGNTQAMRPAFLDPLAMQIQVGLLGGSMNVQVDATVFLALGGQTYTLAPDLTLGGIPAAHTGDDQWQDGPSHYVYRIKIPTYGNSGQGATLAPRP